MCTPTIINPPHRHVFWAGTKVAVVDLRPVAWSHGDRLPRAGFQLVEQNADELFAAWQRLNAE